jgi:hypothetical protein
VKHALDNAEMHDRSTAVDLGVFPDRAGTISVDDRGAASRIVNGADRRLISAEMLEAARLETKIVPHLLGHPYQGHIGKSAVRIAATDIGVNAGEPDLLDPLGTRRVDLPDFLRVRVIDPDRMKGGALIVERERMPCPRDLV